ncbi:hypothetical protein B9J78_03915 [bacterium Unc6]|nr:hypothetical protein [bacterium Unc6]
MVLRCTGVLVRGGRAHEELGLGTVIVGAFSDSAVKKVLGLPKNLEPLAVMPVGYKK